MSESTPKRIRAPFTWWLWLPVSAIVIALLTLNLMAMRELRHHDQPTAIVQVPATHIENQVAALSRQLDELRQEQAMPSTVLSRYRGSIGYIYGLYSLNFGKPAPGGKPAMRSRVAGTGFIIAKGLMATNRHVAEPWYGDAEADAMIRRGATPRLEKLYAFFPGLLAPIALQPAVISKDSDLAVVRLEDTPEAMRLQPLPLAETQAPAGELVTVIGYPMGIAGMVAKSPTPIYERLAYRHDDLGAASELAALSLIRPSATYGHLGDVVGDKLVYDAPTAHGGSGGPVFDSHGKVVGINTAYMDGFSGGTLGISVSALRPLLVAEHPVAK
jgi:S1-C subfamily serine protease